MLPPIVHEILILALGALVSVFGWVLRELHAKQQREIADLRAKHDKAGSRSEKTETQLAVLEERVGKHDENLHALDGRARSLEEKLTEVATDVKVSRQILEDLRARLTHTRRGKSSS